MRYLLKATNLHKFKGVTNYIFIILYNALRNDNNNLCYVVQIEVHHIGVCFMYNMLCPLRVFISLVQF